jgi:hypothetical protein
VDGPAWRYEGSADGMARHVADAIVKHCLPQDLCWMDVTFLSTSTSVYLQPLKKEVPPDLCAVSDCARSPQIADAIVLYRGCALLCLEMLAKESARCRTWQEQPELTSSVFVLVCDRQLSRLQVSWQSQCG